MNKEYYELTLKEWEAEVCYWQLRLDSLLSERRGRPNVLFEGEQAESTYVEWFPRPHEVLRLDGLKSTKQTWILEYLSKY